MRVVRFLIHPICAMFNGILGMSVIGLLLYASVWLSEVVLTPWCRAVQLH